MKLILIGFMSSGKSTIGKQLAYKLNMNFIDIDEVFEEKYKISIIDFFEKYGETKFRELEHVILLDSLKNNNIVISTGGGTPCFYNNMNFINQNGISIYLKLHPNSIFERLKTTKKQRPLVKKLTPEKLKEYIINQLIIREVYYNKAHFTYKIENLKTNELIEILKSDFYNQNLIFPAIE